MKLAVLSDIHGNLPALQAVVADIDHWQPDMTLVNGDIVNSGPSNPACWRLVDERRRRSGWRVLRGNHEDYVAEWADLPAPPDGPAYDLVRLSHWVYRQLNGDVAELAALPERWSRYAPDGSFLLAMHASLLGNRAGIYPHTPDEEARSKVPGEARLFITAHTHVPHVRCLDQTLLVNGGSVGLPGDGDRRAAYARLTWTPRQGWRATLVRLNYDLAAAENDFYTSGYLDEAGPEALLSLVEFRAAQDLRTRWSRLYRERILSGEITHARAVEEFLFTPEFRPYFP